MARPYCLNPRRQLQFLWKWWRQPRDCNALNLACLIKSAGPHQSLRAVWRPARKQATHRRARVLPPRRSPATYPARWQALGSSDSVRPAPLMQPPARSWPFRFFCPTGTNKPAGWQRWRAAEKVEHLLGMNLDRVHDYPGWLPHELDPHSLRAEREVGGVAARARDGRSRRAVRAKGAGEDRSG